MGDGEKLLTYLNSALKVLLGLDIFPRVPKKKLNFVASVINELLKKRPAIYKTLGFISMFRKSPLDSILSQLDPLDTLTTF